MVWREFLRRRRFKIWTSLRMLSHRLGNLVDGVRRRPLHVFILTSVLTSCFLITVFIVYNGGDSELPPSHEGGKYAQSLDVPLWTVAPHIDKASDKSMLRGGEFGHAHIILPFPPERTNGSRSSSPNTIPNTKSFSPPFTSLPLVTPFRKPLIINGSKPKVLIYAKLRTGSTFASEFFNQNDDFFYIFEPLQLINKTDRYMPVDWAIKALSCQFQDLWHAGRLNPLHTNKSLPGWKRKIFCYKYRESDICAAAPISEIERNCSDYKATVSKIISVPLIRMLVPLINEGVKIVHLVRDPRGVESSRLRVMAGSDPNGTRNYISQRAGAVLHDTRLYCNQIREDLNHISLIFNDSRVSHSPYYTIVRYEDLALTPTRELHRMYQSLDLPEDYSVNRWVSGLSDTSRNSSATESQFGTFRVNSADTALRWRRHIPWFLVDNIQQECADVMDRLGYRRLQTQSDLEEYSVDVLEKDFKKR